jgi:hypothetical protein
MFQGTATMLTQSGIFCTAAHCVNVGFGEKDITGRNAWDPGDFTLWAVHYEKAGQENVQGPRHVHERDL